MKRIAKPDTTPSGLPQAVQVAEVAVVLHLSDPHFGTEEPGVVDALVALAERERPDVVLASGDITQRARIEEFERAVRFFDRLPTRHVMVVPGNDDLPLWDLPRRLLAPYDDFRAAFGDNLEPRLQSPHAWIACLVSSRPWRHRDGMLSGEQVRCTARWLRGAPAGALKVVVAHHPLAALRWYEEDNVLVGADYALDQWLRADVDLVLGGHTHAPCAVPITHAGAAFGSRTLWVAQAGSAVSRCLRGNSAHSVNLLRRRTDDSWRLEQWDYHPPSSAFTRRGWREIARSPRACVDARHAFFSARRQGVDGQRIGISLQSHGAVRPVQAGTSAHT
jgi:3',5'-cyclic AMP phosphodiesterase CpdA